MNASALIMMITVETIVILFTGWFFYKVLTTKPKPEPDSYSENDGTNKS
ncbi:MAG: hypothetical protein M9948_09045 [Lentimicrobium sp.]|nr:hypothetical protein [Lentimicrobium sp.]